MSELKACPFCGGEASISKSSNGMMNVMYSIGCDSPCIIGPSLLSANECDAIDKWNKRPHENKSYAVHKCLSYAMSKTIVSNTVYVKDIMEAIEKLERGDL